MKWITKGEEENRMPDKPFQKIRIGEASCIVMTVSWIMRRRYSYYTVVYLYAWQFLAGLRSCPFENSK